MCLQRTYAGAHWGMSDRLHDVQNDVWVYFNALHTVLTVPQPCSMSLPPQHSDSLVEISQAPGPVPAASDWKLTKK